MLRVAVLQHVACEPAGSYAAVLEASCEVETFLMGADDVPSLAGYDAAVCMGGPMGVYDIEAYPWLEEEIAVLRAAIEDGLAVWGVCLGAQLLAAAAGAAVTLGPQPEVGVGVVRLADGSTLDPVFGDLPSTLPVLHWHQDTFDLPHGAIHLAVSDRYPNQAFRYGRSYGLQFHLEASAELAMGWLQLPEYRASLERARGIGGRDSLQRNLTEHGANMAGTARLLMTRWLDQVVAVPTAR